MTRLPFEYSSRASNERLTIGRKAAQKRQQIGQVAHQTDSSDVQRSSHGALESAAEMPPRFEEHDLHGVSFNEVQSCDTFVHDDCYVTVGRPTHSDGPHHADAVSHNQRPRTEEELRLDDENKKSEWQQVCIVNNERVPCLRHSPDRHYRQQGIQFCRLDRFRQLKVFEAPLPHMDNGPKTYRIMRPERMPEHFSNPPHLP